MQAAHLVTYLPQLQRLDLEILCAGQAWTGKRVTHTAVPIQQVGIQPDRKVGGAPDPNRVLAYHHKKIVPARRVGDPVPVIFQPVRPHLEHEALPVALVPRINP